MDIRYEVKEKEIILEACRRPTLTVIFHFLIRLMSAIAIRFWNNCLVLLLLEVVLFWFTFCCKYPR